MEGLEELTEAAEDHNHLSERAVDLVVQVWCTALHNAPLGHKGYDP